MAQYGVLLFLFAEPVGVEADVLKHTLARVLELGAVALFDGVQGLVDPLAIARLVATLMEGVEAGLFRQHEALVLEHLFNQLRFITIFGLVAVVVILPDIGDVFQEQHGEDEVLVAIGADGTPEGIASRPGGLVDIVLVYRIGHESLFLGLLLGKKGVTSEPKLLAGRIVRAGWRRWCASSARRCVAVVASGAALHAGC
ncbi:hypothetical protein D3C86_1322990 [compost metagenome]